MFIGILFGWIWMDLASFFPPSFFVFFFQSHLYCSQKIGHIGLEPVPPFAKLSAVPKVVCWLILPFVPATNDVDAVTWLS
jgi:hypothetical protein